MFSTLTMSELNTIGTNDVWFTGITQWELLYNITVYQNDIVFEWWIWICLMASTEPWNPEQANLIEGENITWTPGAVMVCKFTSGGGIDNLRFVHWYHCHIRWATHPRQFNG